MDKILYRKLNRLKEEALYLKENKERFLKDLRTSIDTQKIVERSIFMLSLCVPKWRWI